jgi:hypothetical protein
LEAYVSAAGKISRVALGDVNAPTRGSYSVPADYTQNHHVDGLPFGTRGGMLIHHEFPAEGTYIIRIQPILGNTGNLFDTVKGEQMEVLMGRRAIPAIRLR